MFANVIYAVALLLLSPMILYRLLRHGRYRRGIGEKLLGLSSARGRRLRGSDECIWIHAVSVGEVNLVRGIVQRLQQSCPQLSVVISTSTDTGYDVAVERYGAERVFFCPLDFTWAVKRTIRHLGPVQLVLAELELWPNLIRIARSRGCEVMVINARLGQRSADRYQRLTMLSRPMFEGLTWVGCQDEACRRRFAACGTPPARLQVTGSIKFDDAPTTRESPDVQCCFQWTGADPWHRNWVVGSTHAGEEEMALGIYKELRADHPELRLILVPRHRERFDEVARLVSETGLHVHRRSSDSSLFDARWDADTVILVDTIGELRHWWGVAHIATVGGSFGDRGGQNMLEPAGYGCAVSFGPNTRNFEEIAKRLIDAGGAVRVHNRAELADFVCRCLTDIPAADSLGRCARQVVEAHQGASGRTIAALLGETAATAETRSAA